MHKNKHDDSTVFSGHAHLAADDQRPTAIALLSVVSRQVGIQSKSRSMGYIGRGRCLKGRLR